MRTRFSAGAPVSLLLSDKVRFLARWRAPALRRRGEVKSGCSDQMGAAHPLRRISGSTLPPARKGGKRCPICKSDALTYAVPGTGEKPLRGSPYARITELEGQLREMESALESTHNELDQLRMERDFYRQLLEDPAKRQERELRRGAVQRGATQPRDPLA